MNKLYLGDCLNVIRDHIDQNSADLFKFRYDNRWNDDIFRAAVATC